MDTHFGSFRDVSFPPFFFFLNRCTYEFANFYVIYIYICFVCMCLCTVCMTFLCNVLCAIVVCVQ